MGKPFCYKTAAKALLLLGALLLVFYLFKDDFTDKFNGRQHKYEGNVSQKSGQNKYEWNASQKSPPTSKPTFVYSGPSCHQNVSVADITGFTSLPGNIKDFLYYRHCRHFPMLLDLPDKCGGADNSAEVFLLLVIKSAPTNYERRAVLRKTWANERLHNDMLIRRVFLSGTSGTGFEKRRLNKLLELENREHGDILQWDFHDTHYNLTLKQILFLEWMERNCPQAHFLLNGDDDVFANTDNMVEFLQSHKSSNKHLFVGHLVQNDGPIRDASSKYYIPVQLHESNSYPPFCPGGGILMSGYTASVMYEISKNITIFPLDDIYLAMCVAKAGLKPEDHMGIRTQGLHIPSQNVDPFDPCFYKDTLVIHRYMPPEIYVMWHSVHDPDKKWSLCLLDKTS